MRLLCATCRRRFEEAEFCPFDGAPLVAIATADQPTQVSGPISLLEPPRVPYPGDDLPTIVQETEDAELPRSRVPLERRRTFPLTPTPVAAAMGAVATHEVVAARTRPARPSSKPPRLRAPSDPLRPDWRSALEDREPAMGSSVGPSVDPAIGGSISASIAPRVTPRLTPSVGLSLDPSDAQRDGEYDRLIGQTLDGRYLVENKIGEGGMGVVFAARHVVIERPLAIKVLKREAMRDAATITRFVREAKAASRIGHPNIVDVTDFGTTPDGMTYSVMEYVPGETLAHAIRFGAPFAPLRAIRITAQIARALGAAHDKGIVHRDLKPENVFLTDREGREDFVKIVDFGIAKVLPAAGEAAGPRLTRAGSVFGTPEYMAPEQAAGRSDTDGRVDIYALGVILYEMICGRVPHRGDSMVRTLAMQMLDKVEPPSRARPDLAITPALEAVVMHALAKRREERYADMAELLAALDAILPPMVGHSITGSPVYSLAALPPGADPGLVTALPPTALQSSAAATPPRSPPGASRGSAAGSSAGSAAGDPGASFDHPLTGELMPPADRRWPIILGLALAVGATAGAISVTLGRRAAAPPAGDPRDPALATRAVRRDAGAVANEREAVRASEPMLDAGRPADASEIIAVEPDAAHRSRLAHDDRPEPPEEPVASDASSSPRTPNRRGAIAIQVITRPEGAHLYDGEGHYRGPGGAQLEEPYGARLTVSCRQPGYKPGSVELRFDGTAGTALCVLERIKVCINNIKNPFDDCEIDPDAPTPAAPAIPETADAAAASVAPPTAPASGESVDAAPTPAASSPTAPAEP